jgi:hypothetical protein
MHNHYDDYSVLPRADGHEDNKPENTKIGLSWRVHLLPYLGESKLYQKFKFDEPWDGPNNSKLIAEMPAVYRSAGATKPGETCFHVMLSSDTKRGFMFNNIDLLTEKEKVDRSIVAIQFRAVGFAQVIDGTSNTIMAVEAGPSTAAPWTKPGGLVVDFKDPKAALAMKGDSVLMLFGDGVVRMISLAKVDDELMVGLLTRSGSEVQGTAKAASKAAK